MSVTLETCIADNIAKFSQPKNPIYKMVYVYNKVEHDSESFRSKKVTRLVELVENLDKCEEIAYNSRLYVLQFFDKNRENNIINDIIKKYSNNVIFD